VHIALKHLYLFYHDLGSKKTLGNFFLNFS
jgi:hypothetical protein